MKLLIYPPVDELTLARIGMAAPVEIVNAQDEAQALAVIGDADAFYGSITPSLLAAGKRLRWVQSPMAGLDHYMFPELEESQVTLTNMAGIYSDHIADHVMAYVYAFARGLHIYLRRQLQREWRSDAPVIHLADQTLGIVGLGGIGTEVARRGAAAGMRVVATDARSRVKPAFVHELWDAGRLDALLDASDFVVVTAPQAPSTVHLIGAEQLTRMKASAYLINVSRGPVVDLAALTEALQQGRIAGAGLDVFEVEPLPAQHALWGMEHVIITPHAAARSPHTAERRLALLAENLRRFLAGEPLLNVVDKRHWF